MGPVTRFVEEIKELFPIKRLISAFILAAASTVFMSITSAATCTYLIYDGDEPRIVRTTLRDTAQVLALCGIETDAHDLVEGPLTADSGFANIRIGRAFEISIAVDGRKITVFSTGETVQSLLSRAGIRLGNCDEVTPALAAPLLESTTVRVLRNTSRIEEIYEDIPFDHISLPSQTIDFGENLVKQKGMEGRALTKIEIFEQEGVETGRNVLSRTVVEQPVTQISEVGVGGTVTTGDGKVYRFSKYIDVTATAYSTEKSTGKITAIGTVARVGAIAVDPRVIPLRSRVYICSRDGKRWVYGIAVAEDTGSSIKGNKIDLFFDTVNECLSFGVKKARVYLIQ